MKKRIGMKITRKPSGLITKTDLPMFIFNGKNAVLAMRLVDWQHLISATVRVNK